MPATKGQAVQRINPQSRQYISARLRSCLILRCSQASTSTLSLFSECPMLFQVSTSTFFLSSVAAQPGKRRLELSLPFYDHMYRFINKSLSPNSGRLQRSDRTSRLGTVKKGSRTFAASHADTALCLAVSNISTNKACIIMIITRHQYNRYISLPTVETFIYRHN